MYFHLSLYKGYEYCSKMATATLLFKITHLKIAHLIFLMHFRIKIKWKNTTNKKNPPKTKQLE